MLIHATITVSGDPALLVACAARLRRRLSAHFLNEEAAEHHGDHALCYDLKVDGGLPFPLFAEVSQEFPGLEFTAEWVNVEAGARGSATIVNGRIAAQEADRLAVGAGSAHPVYVSIALDGSLRLALTVLRAGRDEWRGYAVSATRDALVRIVRGPAAEDVTLYATEGGAEWALAWRGAPSVAELSGDTLTPPLSIEDAAFEELEIGRAH